MAGREGVEARGREDRAAEKGRVDFIRSAAGGVPRTKSNDHSLTRQSSAPLSNSRTRSVFHMGEQPYGKKVDLSLQASRYLGAVKCA